MKTLNKIKYAACGLAALLGVALGSAKAEETYCSHGNLFLGSCNYASEKVSGNNFKFDAGWQIGSEKDPTGIEMGFQAGVDISNYNSNSENIYDSNYRLAIIPCFDNYAFKAGIGINWQMLEREKNIEGITNKDIIRTPVYQTTTDGLFGFGLSGAVIEFESRRFIPASFSYRSANGTIEDFVRKIDTDFFPDQAMGYYEARTPLNIKKTDMNLEFPVDLYEKLNFPVKIIPSFNWLNQKESGNKTYYRIDDYLAQSSRGFESDSNMQNEFKNFSYGINLILYEILQIRLQKSNNEINLNGDKSSWNDSRVYIGIGSKF